MIDPPSPSVTQEFSNCCDDWRHKVYTWLSFVLKDESDNDVGGCIAEQGYLKQQYKSLYLMAAVKTNAHNL